MLAKARVLSAEANNFLDFWKVPIEWYRLVSIRNGVTCIGEPVGEIEAQAHEPTALHALLDEDASIFCSVSSLVPGDDWEPILFRRADRQPLAWTTPGWRGFIFAFDVQQAIDDLLSEEYRKTDSKATSTGQVRKLYYRLRPFMPRALQMKLRQRYARTQGLIPFPAWPIEDSLMFLLHTLLWCLAQAAGDDAAPHLAFWPGGKRCCVVLTHDVEQLAGVNNIDPVAAIEKTYGLRSAWNFVPERYPFDRVVLKRLQDQGFEIGVHGLKHDGRLFESRRLFERRASRINAYGDDWGSVGFRSPATHRIYPWIADRTLDFLYDSSYPDTDPYQPLPGGCCSVFPSFIGGKVEIPLTMPQDHVLFETLLDESTARWHEKFAYIERVGGMSVILVHPDYVISPRRLKLYEEFVAFLSRRKDIWFALPCEVAEWWMARRGSFITAEADHSPRIIQGANCSNHDLQVAYLPAGNCFSRKPGASDEATRQSEVRSA